MILHRYMSEQEFDAYRNGKVLKNTTVHSKNGAHTDSVGFCFFPEDPDEAIRCLRGIVNDDVCVTFDIPDGEVKESRGLYCDHDKSDDSWEAVVEDILNYASGKAMENVVTIEKTEYCCTKYSSKTFRLVDYHYSERLLFQKKVLKELERTKDELPEGVLLQGKVYSFCSFRAFNLIYCALENTPLRGGRIDLDYYEDNLDSFRITLSDGRVIKNSDNVEIHADGTVFINGSSAHG